MPKNTKGGKKTKSKKKTILADAQIILANKGELYGRVGKKTGGRTMQIQCSDNVTRIGMICGKMRLRSWMDVGDIVLVSLRESTNENNVCDIMHKYPSVHAKQLKKDGLINFDVKEDEPKFADEKVLDTGMENICFEDI